MDHKPGPTTVIMVSFLLVLIGAAGWIAGIAFLTLLLLILGAVGAVGVGLGAMQSLEDER